jgi:hypothetical protein
MLNKLYAKLVTKYLRDQVLHENAKMIIMTLLNNEKSEIYFDVLTKLRQVWQNIEPYNIHYSLKEIDDAILAGQEKADSIIQEFKELHINPEEYLEFYNLILQAEKYFAENPNLYEMLLAEKVSEYLIEHIQNENSKTMIISILENETSFISKEILTYLNEAWPAINPINFKFNLRILDESINRGGDKYESILQEFVKYKIQPVDFIRNYELFIRALEFAIYEVSGYESFKFLSVKVRSHFLRGAIISGLNSESIKKYLQKMKLFHENVQLYFENEINSDKHNQYFPSVFTEISVKQVFDSLENEGFIEHNDNLELLFKEDKPSECNRIVWQKKLPHLVYLSKRIWGLNYAIQFNDIVVTLFKLKSGKELTKSNISTAHSAINKTIERKSIDKLNMVYKKLYFISLKLQKKE